MIDCACTLFTVSTFVSLISQTFLSLDSVRLKKKRFQMIKSKAQTGSTLTDGVDVSSRNIQEDILCLMFHKGFKRGKDDVAESVIKG